MANLPWGEKGGSQSAGRLEQRLPRFYYASTTYSQGATGSGVKRHARLASFQDGELALSKGEERKGSAERGLLGGAPDWGRGSHLRFEGQQRGKESRNVVGADVSGQFRQLGRVLQEVTENQDGQLHGGRGILGLGGEKGSGWARSPLQVGLKHEGGIGYPDKTHPQDSPGASAGGSAARPGSSARRSPSRSPSPAATAGRGPRTCPESSVSRPAAPPPPGGERGRGGRLTASSRSPSGRC